MRAPEWRRWHGQGLTEYIVIVALVALAAIGAIATYGNDIRSLFGGGTEVLSGSTNVTLKMGDYTGYKDNDTLQTFGNNDSAVMK